ncbi:YciI family protein [Hamadaea sp. NPDC050747]|uniref:YciI family protein n=1 Tax=Hamadaea sp. NPDC050747 TaxID=3155789 RepID=UPI0033FCC4F7
MANYLLLIYGDEQKWAGMSPDEWAAHDQKHREFQAAAGARSLGGKQLADAATATTLRSDDSGAMTTTDGPFLETKEVLGGYYLIEAADLDEATALAALLPEVYAGHSGVEIRPVV